MPKKVVPVPCTEKDEATRCYRTCGPLFQIGSSQVPCDDPDARYTDCGALSVAPASLFGPTEFCEPPAPASIPEAGAAFSQPSLVEAPRSPLKPPRSSSPPPRSPSPPPRSSSPPPRSPPPTDPCEGIPNSLHVCDSWRQCNNSVCNSGVCSSGYNVAHRDRCKNITPPPASPSYCTRDNAVMWSNRGQDIYATTGLHIPEDVKKPWEFSNMSGTLEECEKKCNSLELCQGFSFDERAGKCWFKRTKDQTYVSNSNQYDFVYKC